MIVLPKNHDNFLLSKHLQNKDCNTREIPIFAIELRLNHNYEARTKNRRQIHLFRRR